MSTLRPQPIGIPAPRPSSRSAEYWQAAKRGELSYRRCSNCGFVGLRPFVVCAGCLGRESERRISAGRGTLYSWTVVWRPPDPAFSVPYAPAVIELEEGFFMVSAVVGCEPEDLVAGMPLTVEFHDASDEIALPYFFAGEGRLTVPATIRPVSEADWDGWKVLWDGYLDFYREHLDEATSRFTFDRLCRLEDGLFGFVAEEDDGLHGIVNALVHPSTWTKGCYCYLEDLFVARSSRGSRTARGLIEAVTTEATARGAAHVYWHTQQFNGAARSLYDQMARLTSFVVYER